MNALKTWIIGLLTGAANNFVRKAKSKLADSALTVLFSLEQIVTSVTLVRAFAASHPMSHSMESVILLVLKIL